MYLYFRVYFIVFCFSSVLAGKKYRVSLVSADKCPLPKTTVDRTEPVLYEIGVMKLSPTISVIKTNYAILRPVGPVLMNFRIYTYELKEKKLVFKLEKVDCHSPFTYQLLRVINLKVDTKCMAVPGNYTTNNINLQDFAWIVGKSVISPGKYIYDMEFYTAKGGIAVCVNVVCDIQVK